jgi:hypothetical protein
VDNNTTSGGNSIHGSASRIFNADSSTVLTGSFSVNSSVGTANSFIMLRCESACGEIVIDNLSITTQ